MINTTRNYQRFVNVETAVNIQNGAAPPILPTTVGFKEGTLRWTIVLGGITDEDNGTIQEASILAYLWRRTAATNNQPNIANWQPINDDNNVFDTGTINSNFPDRYKTSTGAIVQNQSAATAAGKYGGKLFSNKIRLFRKRGKAFRMTSFYNNTPSRWGRIRMGFNFSLN